MIKPLALSLATILLLASITCASEKKEACVKYRKDFNWSKGYSVIATVISGSDLNQAVGSLNRFQSFATYAVVFWTEGQATILQLPSYGMGSLPMLDQEVEDQGGRKWTIRAGNISCY